MADNKEPSIERHKLRLEKELHYLERWKADIVPVEQHVIEAERGAIAFAQTALKSGFILNGGALIVLPAFMQIFSVSDVASAYITITILCFTGGLFLCGIGALLAYLAMSVTEQRLGFSREIRVLRLNEEHNPSADKTQHTNKLEEAINKEKRFLNLATRLRAFGFLCMILALVSFAAGTILGTLVILPS